MADPALFLDPTANRPAPPPRPGVPRFTVRPGTTTSRTQAKPETPGGSGDEEGSAYDLPAYSEPAAQPAAGAAAPAPGDEEGSAYDLPAYVDTSVPMQPERPVGTGEAAATGVLQGATLGFAPAMAGAANAMIAATPQTGPLSPAQVNQYEAPTVDPGAYAGPGLAGGLAAIKNMFASNPDQAISTAYDQGRQDALKQQELARTQHPGAYYPGMVAGSLMVPAPGLGTAGTLGGNIARAAGSGAVIGGISGVGEGVSRGESLPEIAARAGTGAVTGGVTGAPFGAVMPRGLPAVLSPGQQAAQTAADLGGNIPRGLASDRGALQTTTAALKSTPLFGARVAHSVADVQERAGNYLGDIAAQMTGGPVDRAAVGANVRPGLDAAVARIKGAINTAYGRVENGIDGAKKFAMPRTKAALDEIERKRAAAGVENPGKDLGQWRRVSEGATFEGAQRARADARDAGDPLSPHPGFNAADFNYLTRAMTDDLRAIVYSAAHGNAQARHATLDAFDRVEAAFGPASDYNKYLKDLARGDSESAIATLMGAAQEKRGDLDLLTLLQRTMPPTEFKQIGGQLLHELGNTPNGFSLATFVTNWGKLNPRAPQYLFSPQHRQDIENIVQMGAHIKGALKTANTSHTAAPLILLDLARDAIMTGAGVAMGLVPGVGVATGAAIAAPGVLFAHWLSGPATARAMSGWTRAYQAVLGSPTPARIAAFKIATRNLASNLNLPVETVMQTIQNRLPATAQPSPDQRQ